MRNQAFETYKLQRSTTSLVVRATVQKDSGHSRKYVSMKVWMEDEEGKVLRPLDKDRELHFDTPDIMSDGVVVADSVMVVMKMKSYLEEDRPLSVKVGVKILNPRETVVDESSKDVIDTMKQMYDTRAYADMIFISKDGKEVQAHACIVSSKSAPMADHVRAADVENGARKVKFDTLTGNELEALIEFFYLAKKPRNENAPALLRAADIYELSSLKEICEVILVDGINMHNAIERLVISHEAHAYRMKFRVYRFLTAHLDEVLKMAAYKDLVYTHTELSLEASKYLSAGACEFQMLDFASLSKSGLRANIGGPKHPPDL